MDSHTAGAGLRRHADFNKLWAADTVSQVGTAVSQLALPLVAVKTLHASTLQVGILTAAETAAFLLVGLPAGAWVDRLRRRPLMVTTDLARAVLLGSVPVAAVFHVLTLPQLYVVALLVGVMTVFFDVSYQSYLPSLVGRSHLVEGNAKLQASQSVAQVGGPTLGGWTVQLLTAPIAVAVDAVSYLASAVGIGAIRKPEPAPERPESGRRLVEEISEGLRFVFSQRLLWAIAGCTGTSNFFSSALTAVTIPFLVRDIGLSAGTIGTVFSASSVGGLLGAMVANRIARWVGSARTIWLSLLVTAPFGLLAPLTEPGWRVSFVAIAVFAIMFGAVVYNVAQVSFRQALCPDRLLGRMNATMRFLVWGTMPLGGLAGGALGSALDNRAALWAAVVGQLLAPAWVVLSPMRRMRDMPSTEPEPEPEAEAGAGAEPTPSTSPSP